MLLAFDTATPHVTVALHDGSSVVASWESSEAMRHGEMLAPGIQTVLSDAFVRIEDVTGIAVGVGPGPFTGLRVGLVTARTMAHVRSLPVHGVCTLDVLAEEARTAGHDEMAVAIDARRKEVYVATYAHGRRTSGPEVRKPMGAATSLPTAGRGALMYPEFFPHAIAPEHPSAAVLATMVAQGSADVLPPEPLYLRRPDAVEPGKPKRVS